MKAKDITLGMIAVAIIISLIGGGIVYFISDDNTEPPESDIEMGPLTQRLTSVTSLHISENEAMNIEDMENSIRSQLPGWIDGAAILVPGYSVTLRSFDISLNERDMFVKIPSYSPNIIQEGSTTPNSLMYGTTGTIPLVPSIISHVTMKLVLIPEEGGKDETISLSYTSETIDTSRALQKLLSYLENDMNGWTSGLARDVEYMLNSLVRLRAKNGIGTSFTDNYLHLLNEGDVELAVNFAIAMRFTAWTGTIPSSLLDRIDAYYAELGYGSVMNPTGKRSWGESEKDNFKDYVTRTKGEDPRRSASDLFTLFSDISHADPADLFLRYLYMDRAEETMGSMEPIDLMSPLVENQMLNPRQPTDTEDPYALEHHTIYPDRNGIDVYLSEDLAGEEDVDRSFKPSITSSYLTSGNELTITGIHEYSAKYTTANPELTDKDLIAWANATQFNKPTRCGAIAPPPKPENHDYRVQWDLNIKGVFDVSAENTGWSGNTYSDPDAQRMIRFNIPVRIFAGTGNLVLEGFPTNSNINQGLQFYTPISTGWVITPEANATETFENDVWPTVRDAFSHMTSMARTAGQVEKMEDQQGARRTLHSIAEGGLSALDDWSESDSRKAQIEISKLYTIFIMEKGLDITALDPIGIEGHDITFSYSPGRNRLDIISTLPEGELRLRIWPISGGVVNTAAIVTLISGNRLELEIDEGTFGLHGTYNGKDIFEGSSDPNAPANSVWTMLGTGQRTISQTVTLPLSLEHDPYMTDIDGSSASEVSAAIILRNDRKVSISLDKLPTIQNNDILDLFRTTVPHANDLGLSIGIQVTFKGETNSQRSVIFSSLTEEDLEIMDSRKTLEDIFNTLVLSSRLDIDPVIGEEMLVTETFSMEPDGDQITSAAYISPLGSVTFSYFSGSTEYQQHEGWTNLDVSDTSPLW